MAIIIIAALVVFYIWLYYKINEGAKKDKDLKRSDGDLISANDIETARETEVRKRALNNYDDINKVKLGYLYAYLGKLKKNYENNREYFAACQKDNDILEEQSLGNLTQNTRSFVFKRDKWQCVLCDEKVSKNLLQVHHVKYNSRGGLGKDEPENLVTLCIYCHAGLPYHYKIPEQYRHDIELRNKKIILNIAKKMPGLIDKTKKLCFVVEPNYFVEVYELERERYFIYQAAKDFSPESPLGKTLIGVGKGKVVEVEIPGKKIRTLKILEIYPPDEEILAIL